MHLNVFYLHEQRVRVELPVGRPGLHEEAVLQVSEESLHLHCEVLVVVRVPLPVLQQLRHGHGGVVGRGEGGGATSSEPATPSTRWAESPSRQFHSGLSCE